MPMNNEVLAIVLGGGQGSRLFPLTLQRSKPAVPIGGSYRLIDIPISNCLHADIRRIFVLTQFNSASLNRHISQAYRMDAFSQGFVDILAAEQTPDNPNWYQGTADAVRQAARHFVRFDADYYLILAGDHLYRMDYAELVDAHHESRADITIAAQPISIDEASAMGIFRFDRAGQIVAFEEKPKRERLQEIGQSIPAGSTAGGHTPDKPFVASMGVYVFSRDVLLEAIEQDGATDFGRQIIPNALGRSRRAGAAYYEADDDAPARGANPKLGVGRDAVLDRVIVDKNARIGDGARLVNEKRVQDADGDGYYIRDGVVIVPKDGVVKPGTMV